MLALSCAVSARAATPHKTPPCFVQNVGQLRFTNGAPAVQVDAAFSHGSTMWYAFAGGMHIVQSKNHASLNEEPTVDLLRVDAEFVGANTNARVEVTTYGAGYETFIVPETGRGGRRAWRASQLVYHDVWPGIDVRLTSNVRGVKVDYIVRVGADPSVIATRYHGITNAVVDANNGLQLHTAMATLSEAAPVAWTQDDYSAVAVQTVLSGTTVRYQVDEYDVRQTVIIDPQIEFATYYGSNACIDPVKTTIDPDGNVFIAGSTITRDLPQVVGVFQPRLKAKTDAFIGKFTDAGVFLWNTYVGGTGNDYCFDIAADTSGSVWICGSLDSMNNPLVDTTRGLNDVGSGPFGGLTGDTISLIAGYVMRVTSSGAWADSWVMDGNRNDRCTGIAFKNNVLVFCGETNSTRVNEMNGGAWAKNGANNTNNYDLFVAHCSLRPSSTDRWRGDWLVYYGGDLEDRATCIDVDGFGNVACAGITLSTNVPVTDASVLQGGADAVVVYFATLGGAADRRWARYLGGTDPTDYVFDVAMDSQGNPVFTGHTASGNFPVLNAFQAARKGLLDGFVTKITGLTGAITWSTYLGGNATDAIYSVSLDKSDRVWVGGVTNGSTDLPVSADALQNTPHITAEWPNLSDGFIAQLAANGATRLYCSYYGAEPQDNLPPPPTPPDPPSYPVNTDFGYDAVRGVHADGNAYVAIASTIDGRRMITTPNAFMDAADMNADTTKHIAFLSMLNNCPDSTINIVVNGTPVLCDNDSRELRGPSGFALYKWSSGAKTQNIVVKDSGSYVLTATTADGCRYRDTVYIARAAKPSVWAGPDTSACLNTPVQLTASPSGGTPDYSYKWRRKEPGPQFIDDDSAEQPHVNPNTTSNYIVTITDALGCTATDTVLVTIINPKPLTTGPLTFRDLDACESAVDDTLWVRNPMDYPVQVTGATTSNPTFSVVTDLSSGVTINALDSVPIVLRATPLAPGNTTGTVTINGTPCTWQVTTNLSVSKAQLVASLIPSVVDFGSMLDCVPEARDTVVTVRNSGTNNMTLLVATAAAPFSILSPLADTLLLPGQSVEVHVRYNPPSIGVHNTVVKLPFITGTCKDTLRLTIRGKRVDASITLVPNSIYIGALSGCEVQRDTSIMLVNSGSVPVTVTLPQDPTIVFTPAQQVTVPPNDSIRISLSVIPATNGSFTRTLVLTAEPCNVQLQLTVEGSKTGTSVATPTEIDFGTAYSCAGGPTYSANLPIMYSGAGSATVTSVTTNPGITTTLLAGAVLENGKPQSYTVTWQPGTDGALVDSLVIVFEPCSIRRVIPLHGNRVTPAITATTPLVNLGTISAIATGTLRFSNSGTAPIAPTVLASSSVTIVGTRPPLPASLLPGQTLEVDYSVACRPTITDTITVLGNDTCNASAWTIFTGACTTAGPATSTVVIDSAAVTVGQKFALHLLLTESENLDAAGLYDWEAEITYNPMVIVGYGQTPDCYVNGTYAPCTITVNGKRTIQTGSLADLTFTAVLGNAPQTSVALTRFTWLADTTSAVTTGNGSVTITDICDQGGVRLLNPKAEAFSIHVYPIPASTQLTIDVRGLGTLPGSYSLYTYIGNLVANGVLTPDASGNATAVIDVTPLGSGTYALTIDARGTTYRMPVLITR